MSVFAAAPGARFHTIATRILLPYFFIIKTCAVAGRWHDQIIQACPESVPPQNFIGRPKAVLAGRGFCGGGLDPAARRAGSRLQRHAASRGRAVAAAHLSAARTHEYLLA